MEQSTNNPERAPVPNVPQPLAEIVVRTMASDTASLAQSGGGSPKAYPVNISSRGPSSKGKTGEDEATGIPQAQKKSFFSAPAFKISLLGVFLAGVFFAGYFFAYPLINPPSSETGSAAPVTVPARTQPAEHKSVFSQPVDGILIMTVPPTADGMGAYKDQLKSFVGGLSGSFFEVTPQDDARSPLPAGKFLSSINAKVLEPGFLDANFTGDFTLFLYSDKSGIWPGYVFQLNPGETPLLLQKSATREIESASSAWQNLFLESSGAPSETSEAKPGKFRDELSGGQPIRTMNFEKSSGVIVYGWFFNKYLIISTSIEGLKQAILHF